MLPIDDSQQRYQHRQQTEIESNLTSSHGCNKRVFTISLPVAGLATNLWVATACPAICTEARVTTLAELFFRSLFSECSTGGADLGARLPAAGSLHRAGCEDGRAGQRQDPPPQPICLTPFLLLLTPAPYTTASTSQSLLAVPRP